MLEATADLGYAETTMTKADIKKAALELPVDERAELARAIWDSIPPEEEARLMPLYEWQKSALDEALQDFRQHPESSVSWEEVKAGLWPIRPLRST
jgi:putative addiction module component (TIGR02574 family)